METRTSIDLNGAVAAWRADLEAQDTINSDLAEELETHLLDTVSDLQNSGLTVREAFWVAHDRIGRAEEIAVEFEKVSQGEKWRKRVAWMVGGCLIAFAAQLIMHSAGAIGTLMGVGLGLHGIALPGFAFLAKAGTLGGLAWVGYRLVRNNGDRLRRFFRNFGRRKSTIALVVSGIVLIPILSVALPMFTQLVLARIMDVQGIGELTLYTRATSLVWSVLLPILGGLSLLWLLRKPATPTTR